MEASAPANIVFSLVSISYTNWDSNNNISFIWIALRRTLHFDWNWRVFMHSNVGVEPIGDWEERSSIAYVLGSIPEPDTQRWASKATDLAWATSITGKNKKKQEIINLGEKGYCFSLLGKHSYWEFCKVINGFESLLQGSLLAQEW